MDKTRRKEEFENVLRRIGATPDGQHLARLLTDRLLSVHAPLNEPSEGKAYWLLGRSETLSDLIKNLNPQQ